MALCHALTLVRRKIPFELLVITLDHGLRPESLDEVRFVQQYWQEQDVACASRCLGLAGGANLQERAREARYAALWDIADRRLGSDSFLATAHHADDRAETVLLRLLRGTSLEGLSVLPLRSGRLLRPLIAARREDVLLHLERHGVPYVSDPSNENPRFLRVRVRKELLPLLEELAPGATLHLARLAEEAEQLEVPLGLNREQRDQLRKALKSPQMNVDLPLGKGLFVHRVPRGHSSDNNKK